MKRALHKIADAMARLFERHVNGPLPSPPTQRELGEDDDTPVTTTVPAKVAKAISEEKKRGR